MRPARTTFMYSVPRPDDGRARSWHRRGTGPFDAIPAVSRRRIPVVVDNGTLHGGCIRRDGDFAPLNRRFGAFDRLDQRATTLPFVGRRNRRDWTFDLVGPRNRGDQTFNVVGRRGRDDAAFELASRRNRNRGGSCGRGPPLTAGLRLRRPPRKARIPRRRTPIFPPQLLRIPPLKPPSPPLRMLPPKRIPGRRPIVRPSPIPQRSLFRPTEQRNLPPHTNNYPNPPETPLPHFR
jgi:hypothetical protein